MKNLSLIEAVAKACGFKNRREICRSLEVIQIFDENVSEWILFDPIYQAKDIAKVMFAMVKKHDGYAGSELEFRAELLQGMIDYDNSISKKS